VFVVEQAGYTWTIQSNNVLAQPFLEMTNPVLSGGERGLLGLAFPPNFSSNGHFYLNYTRKPDEATVISRFQVTDPLHESQRCDPMVGLALGPAWVYMECP
jgi:hypothetical protein